MPLRMYLALENLAPKILLLLRNQKRHFMVAATMKISEYAVLIYNFQTGIAIWSIEVKKHCFKAKVIFVLRGRYTR